MVPPVVLSLLVVVVPLSRCLLHWSCGRGCLLRSHDRLERCLIVAVVRFFRRVHWVHAVEIEHVLVSIQKFARAFLPYCVVVFIYASADLLIVLFYTRLQLCFFHQKLLLKLRHAVLMTLICDTPTFLAFQYRHFSQQVIALFGKCFRLLQSLDLDIESA